MSEKQHTLHDELVETCREIFTEAGFTDADGAMDLGERLLQIADLAKAVLAKCKKGK